MKSEIIQYIIVFIILALVIGWVLYSLVRKKPDGKPNCPGCAHSASCSKKILLGSSAKKIQRNNVSKQCQDSCRLDNPDHC